MPRGSTPYARRRDASTAELKVQIDADVLAQARLLLTDQFTGKTAYAGVATLVENLLRTWLRHRREHDAAAAARLDDWARQKAALDSVSVSNELMKMMEKEMPK